LGYEIYYPWNKTKELWQALIAHNKVKPAGLGARDVLRLEMGYSLYGHELGEDISPLESGLNRFIQFEKDFIGKDILITLKDEGLKRKIVGLSSETRRVPREGYQIYLESGEAIGIVTSGTFSPCLNKGIGLGFVDTQHAGQDSKIFFGDDNNKNIAVITSRAFHKSSSLHS